MIQRIYYYDVFIAQPPDSYGLRRLKPETLVSRFTESELLELLKTGRIKMDSGKIYDVLALNEGIILLELKDD